MRMCIRSNMFYSSEDLTRTMLKCSAAMGCSQSYPIWKRFERPGRTLQSLSPVVSTHSAAISVSWDHAKNPHPAVNKKGWAHHLHLWWVFQVFPTLCLLDLLYRRVYRGGICLRIQANYMAIYSYPPVV
jgi:hypothetical protein